MEGHAGMWIENGVIFLLRRWMGLLKNPQRISAVCSIITTSGVNYPKKINILFYKLIDAISI